MIKRDTPINRIGSALLEFNPEWNKLSNDKELRDGLSVVLLIGNTLWVANDETITLERLTRQKDDTDGTYKYSDHQRFSLNQYLQLPVPPPSNPEDIEEVDIEGLDYDAQSGYLWLVGSHSLKRNKVDQNDEDDSVDKNFKRLAKVSSDGNRFLLARIPLIKDGDTYKLESEIEQDGAKLTAARLRGHYEGNDLTKALQKDEHLAPFLAIPGKDNGFDIEGLAVVGERILLGLRGPVLRGWAVILELSLKEDDSSTLRLKKMGPDDRLYRKHFLQLGGLGIRDLCVSGTDLLILAGPTMDLDGPVTVFRWPGGAQPEAEGVVFNKTLQQVEIPFGQGNDHAEGMTLVSVNDNEAPVLLVVYDAASADRKKGDSALEGDIFPFDFKGRLKN